MTFVPTFEDIPVPWATGAYDSLIIKPSSIVDKDDLENANSLLITVKSGSAQATIGTGTISVTISTDTPTVATDALDQTFYQGQGSTTVTGQLITDDDTLAFTIAGDGSATDYTALTIDALDGDPITIELDSSFVGTKTLTITATDPYDKVTTDSFDVVVSACPQTNCVTCTNNGDTDCLTCDSGYTLTAGACDKIVVADSSSSSGEVSNLNSGVGDNKSRAGAGTSIAVGTTAVILVSALSGAAPVITGSAFTQTQVAQIFNLFNMNRPNDYDEFSQSFSVTKLDLKFLDTIELQSSLKDETRRNLASTGYKDLSNVRIDTGSFLVNYIYWFVVVL
jgi:hypothetical protein